MSRRMIVLLVVLLFALAGCFSGEPEVSQQEQVAAADREAAEDEAADAGGGEAAASATFVAVDNEFTDAPGEVPAGAVEITLDNQGAAEHNVAITDPTSMTLVDTTSGGESASNVVELEPGEYEYICEIPGHSATMNGTLTVTG